MQMQHIYFCENMQYQDLFKQKGQSLMLAVT